MKKNVLDYEPELALFVDDSEPLKYYDFIMNFSKNHLNRNGQIFFEINEKFCNKLEMLCREYSYRSITFIKDNFKKNRILVLYK